MSAVDENQHFGDHMVKLKKQSCKSGNGWRRMFNTEYGVRINYGLASPPHAADEPADLMIRNVDPLDYECMS